VGAAFIEGLVVVEGSVIVETLELLERINCNKDASNVDLDSMQSRGGGE